MADVPQIRLPGQAAAAPGPLDMTNMYLAHHGFRRDLGRLVTAVCEVSPRDRDRIDRLRKQLAWVLFVLHHHHRAEDLTVWPLLRARAAEAAEVMDAMEAEHAEAAKWIAECESAFAAFAREPSEPGRAELATALRALADTVGAHLAHEETMAIPLMQAHISAAEDARGHRDIQRQYGPRQMFTLLGWLIDGLPDDAADRLRSQAPPPMRLLAAVAGFCYRRRTSGLWS
ncbi:hemerythrin domain-containing protein [Nonomuraea sp. NN258]|uniref:hemerythrin domain-containing protein n=1 Tax=Nonomuraea antri TaxID=2730852 RepID=UPI0015682C74|nr:hemerythrin domain-containing protein [Nonomuraea antri]NRQ30843.1 hemerythrin domain-containing protein [Nonomuraea antri]